MRNAVWPSVLLILTTFGTPVQACSIIRADPLLRRLVTVEVTEATIPEFLEMISAQASINFILTGSGLDGIRVTTRLRRITVERALRSTLGPYGIRYQRVGGGPTYTIERTVERSASTADTCDVPDTEITVVQTGTLEDIFANISRQTGVVFELAEDVRSQRMTVAVRSVPTRTVIGLIAAHRGLACRRVDPTGAVRIERDASNQ